MKYEIRFSGSGGQGVILASVMLGTAASLYESKFVIQSQAYGPEARGGATKADVIISDENILYPKARHIDYLISLTQKAAEKFIKTVKKGGVVIIDSDFVNLPESPDYKLIKIPMTSATMEKLGKIVALNVVSLAAFVEISKIISFDSLKNSVLENSPKGTEASNTTALELGRELAKAAVK